jgi:FdhD protein
MLTSKIRFLLAEVKNMHTATQKIQMVEFLEDQTQVRESQVITEAPVSLTVNGQTWLTFMCTPVDLEALAVGFLYNEGLIEKRVDLADVRLCANGSNVDVWLTFPLEKPSEWRRTSGCTATSIRPKDHRRYTAEQVYALLNLLNSAQDLYRLSGGVHTSLLSDGKRMLVAAEDIGRHNTLDKIAGYCFLHELAPEQRVLVTTGRISSEMMQKAARLGADLVISRTSPSVLSVQIAQGAGITLVGYARPRRFLVYTHPERITSSQVYENYAVPTPSNLKELDE